MDLLSVEQVKEIFAQTKDKTSVTQETTRKLLLRAQHCVMLHVALVNLTKSQNKVGFSVPAVHTVFNATHFPDQRS